MDFDLKDSVDSIERNENDSKKKKEEIDKKPFKGVYHNDYSPRYQSAYNIYEKARNHMKKQKKEWKANLTKDRD